MSDADRAAEEAVRALVAREREGEGVFGEELGDDGAHARWIVDPIDGTRNYVRGVPVWATLLALERDGRVDVALVSAPALRRRWWAARGDGTWADGKQVRVSGIGRLEDAVVSAAGELPAELVARAWSARGFGDFWQHCLVAEGSIELAADPVLELWDYVAVRLLVEEAGGRCTTYGGEEPRPGGSVVSTNGHLHDEALGVLG